MATTDGIILDPVAPFYPNNGAEWNDYVNNDGGTIFTALDTAAPRTGTGGYSAVLHGGEMRSVVVSGKSSCAGLDAYDNLGVFDWTCFEGTNPVQFVTTGLPDGVYLSDLIDFTVPEWKDNFVTVLNGGVEYGVTIPAPWWNNVVNPLNGTTTLDTEGDIYAVASSVTRDLVIDADRVALVTGPGVVIHGAASHAGAATPAFVVVSTNDSFLWIEADLMGASTDTGSTSVLHLENVEHSVLRGVSASDAGEAAGVRLRLSSNNKLREIVGERNKTFGLHMFDSDENDIKNVVLSENGRHGAYIFESDDNLLDGFTAFNNGVDGISVYANGVQINSSDNNRLSSFRMANNPGSGLGLLNSVGTLANGIVSYNNVSQGIFITDGYDNVMTNLTSFNNGSSGVDLISTSNNVLINVTAANNRYGVDLEGSDSNTVNRVVGVNGTRGLGADDSHYNIFSNIVSTDMSGAAVRLADSSDNIFTGSLKVGGITATNDCIVAGSYVNPGLDTDCAPTDSSNADLESDISIDLSFVAKVTTNDTRNDSDSNGTAMYNTITDWVNFENDYRGWGEASADAFPDASHSGNADSTETYPLRIWDWSLDSGDTELLDALPAPGASDTLIHTWFGGGSTTFDRNSLELLDDGSGNDDGLCQAGEDCIDTPNIGSYQGIGE
jgi:parallel beta-helix repeat protein